MGLRFTNVNPRIALRISPRIVDLIVCKLCIYMSCFFALFNKQNTILLFSLWYQSTGSEKLEIHTIQESTQTNISWLVTKTKSFLNRTRAQTLSRPQNHGRTPIIHFFSITQINQALSSFHNR